MNIIRCSNCEKGTLYVPPNEALIDATILELQQLHGLILKDRHVEWAKYQIEKIISSYCMGGGT